jgi:very-short-patch-repair endonuclease
MVPDQGCLKNAKQLRKAMTESEKHLWERLKKKQFFGYKFRRQHPMKDFIADFYCHPLKLVIEIDGGYHETKDQQAYDHGRTYEINELGVTVIRFKNEEVLLSMDGVLQQIEKCIKKSLPFRGDLEG